MFAGTYILTDMALMPLLLFHRCITPRTSPKLTSTLFKKKYSQHMNYATYRRTTSSTMTCVKEDSSSLVTSLPASTTSHIPTTLIPPPTSPTYVSPISSIVNRLNIAFCEHPHASIVCLALSDMMSICCIYTAFNAANVTFSSTFLLAFTLSRPLRRVRLPIEIITAAALSRLMPSLTRVNILALSSALPFGMGKQLRESMKPSKPTPGVLGNVLSKIGGAIEKYGLALMVSQRLVGVTVVMSLYSALRYGIDIDALVKTWLPTDTARIFESSSQFIGTWAGAVVCTSILYPFSIITTAYVAPPFGRTTTMLMHKIRR